MTPRPGFKVMVEGATLVHSIAIAWDGGGLGAPYYHGRILPQPLTSVKCR